MCSGPNVDANTLVAVGGFAVVIIIQTTVVARWAGIVSKTLEQHSAEIATLRSRYHDDVVPRLIENTTTLEHVREMLERGHGDQT